MFKKIAIIGSIVVLTACGDTGGGEKVGSITKLAQQGLLCKTWEGQIIRGGFQNGSGASGAAFDFTIDNNPELVKKVEHLLNTQQEVKLTYRTEFVTWCRSDSRNHFLTDIEALGQEADRPTKIDTSKAVPVVQVTKDDPRASGESRDDKVMRLLQIQQQLITELAKK